MTKKRNLVRKSLIIITGGVGVFFQYVMFDGFRHYYDVVNGSNYQNASLIVSFFYDDIGRVLDQLPGFCAMYTLIMLMVTLISGAALSFIVFFRGTTKRRNIATGLLTGAAAACFLLFRGQGFVTGFILFAIVMPVLTAASLSFLLTRRLDNESVALLNEE